MNSDKPIAFHNLSPECFPFTVQWVAEKTGSVVAETTVEAPGVLEVPALRAIYGPIAVRVHYGDGRSVEVDSKGTVRE